MTNRENRTAGCPTKLPLLGWGFSPLSNCPAGADLQANTFLPLKIGDDSKQVAGGWISLWAEHLVQGLYVQLRLLGQLGKPNCCVNVVAQELLPQRDFSGEKAFNGIAEQPLAERSVASHPRLYCFSKISR